MKKNYDHIKRLLEKFYNGESTPEEEQELSAFFTSAEELPEELEADRKVFAALSEASAFGEAPADLDDNIMAAIDASAAPRRSASRLRRIFIGISAVAAVVALVLFVPFGGEKPTSVNPAGSQLASEKIIDTLKNMELVPEIPSVEQLAAESLATTKGEETQQLAVATSAPVKMVRSKRKASKKTAPEPEEEYTLSEEEIKAMELAFAALDNASYMLSYAYGCMEDSQERIADTPNMIDRILQ